MESSKVKASPIEVDFFERIRAVKRVQAALLSTTNGTSWFETDFKSKGVNRLNDAVMMVLSDETLMAEFNKRNDVWSRDNRVAKALLELTANGEKLDITAQREGVQREYKRLNELRLKKARAVLAEDNA